ncbi:hypothetical protein Dda_5276 [Drechslerella dactyloides]|uniref:DUF676 domain-containing protein n=1 Tax=Drechslerella dactyloides TaxID=74499 RepID=A0AAD6IVS7_DREDA|nr:hypothetical protein Dda_5276 [Drechslerella dactyloides]
MAAPRRRWTHLSPSSATVPNTTNPSLHPYQNPSDTRTSSTASLLPAPDAAEAIRTGESSARTLLCVFIHGFVGDETSFRSFPAHFHELLTVLVQDTHVVHTKVYPKFKTRDKLSYAVENLGRWLSDFESPKTDIILLGHSMGGLLAADAASLHPLCRHRILGHISFDTPFLGIHPGVIKSGLSSLFKPGAKHADDPELPSIYDGGPRHSYDSSMSDASSSSSFIPPSVAPKKTMWQSSVDFFRKHHGEVSRAALAYVNGHLEFSGALLDFRAMKSRYDRVLALEKPDIADRRKGMFGNSAYDADMYVPRVRFVNYYTSCTGRSTHRDKSSTRESGDRSLSRGGAMDPDAYANAYAAMSSSNLPDASHDAVPPPAYSPSPRPSARAISDDKKQDYQVTTEYLQTPSPSRSRGAYPPRKAKNFCVIPKGEDKCWVKVNMENVDEVGAHCGLFFVKGVTCDDESPERAGEGDNDSSVYERLLGDVAQRVEGWCMDWIGELEANPAVAEEVYRHDRYFAGRQL